MYRWNREALFMNWDQYQRTMLQLKQQLLTIEKLHNQQQAIERQIVHVEEDIAGYERQLQESRKQLQKLEKFSFVNLFRTWTGKKDELFEQRCDIISVKDLKLIESQLTKED